MTIDKAGSDNDVDIVIAIDNDDDTTANNDNNNEMTNDITIEIEADTSAAADDNTAEIMTNDIKIELDEEAPPLPQSPVGVEQEQQQSSPLPDLPWWKKTKNIMFDPRVLLFIIIISIIILFACRGRVGDGVLAALIFIPFYILIWVAIFVLICGCANRDQSSFYDNHFGRSSTPNTSQTNQHMIEFPSPLEES